MNKDGMLPQHPCHTCGKPLNADGNHPAELYAGTFTGLCYRCQNAGPFVLETDDLDNALRISYPPHCPSFRRDREVYTAYEDCPDCKGAGFTWTSRPDAHGGSYRAYCKACMDRYTQSHERVPDDCPY